MNELATQNNQIAQPMDSQATLMQDELRLPIVIIIQEKNHLIKQYKDRYEPGMIVETSEGEILGKPDSNGIHTLKFIPIHFKRVWICKNPREKDSQMFDKTYEPGEIIFRTEKPEDPRIAEEDVLAQQRGCKSRMNKFLQFLSYIEGYEMPVIISFGKSSRISGENFLNKLVFAKNGPKKLDFWKRKYKLSALFTEYKEYEFYSFKVEKFGDPDEEELAICKDWANSIARINYQAQVDDAEDEDAQPSSAATPVTDGKERPATEEAPY